MPEDIESYGLGVVLYTGSTGKYEQDEHSRFIPWPDLPDTAEHSDTTGEQNPEDKGWWPVVSINLRNQQRHQYRTKVCHIIWCFYQMLDDEPTAWYIE
jgi:hypothetical protein